MIITKLSLTSVLLLWGSYQTGNDRATIQVALVSNVGGLSLNDSLLNSQAILTSKDTRRLVFRSQDALTFRDVPYGTYELVISPGVGTGFDSSSREVVINQGDSLVVVGLNVAAVDNTPWRDVVGNLKGPVDGVTWVKLASLYSDIVREAKVDGDGTFRFNDVPFGSYVFIPIRDGTPCEPRIVEVLFAKTDLTLECRSGLHA